MVASLFCSSCPINCCVVIQTVHPSQPRLLAPCRSSVHVLLQLHRLLKPIYLCFQQMREFFISVQRFKWIHWGKNWTEEKKWCSDGHLLQLLINLILYSFCRFLFLFYGIICVNLNDLPPNIKNIPHYVSVSHPGFGLLYFYSLRNTASPWLTAGWRRLYNAVPRGQRRILSTKLQILHFHSFVKVISQSDSHQWTCLCGEHDVQTLQVHLCWEMRGFEGTMDAAHTFHSL